MIRYDALPKSVAARDRYDPAKRAAQPIRAQGLTGYRKDSQAHAAARAKVSAERRREIAAAGGRARAAMYGHTAEASATPAAPPRIPPAIAAHIARRIAASETRTHEQIKADAARRAALSRPARRAAQRAREAAARRLTP